MSDGPALEERITKTIHEFLDENGGGFPNSFYFIADIIDGEGQQAWLYSTAHDQLTMTTMGLLQWGINLANYEQIEQLMVSDEDD